MYLKTYSPSFPLWCLNFWASFYLKITVFPFHYGFSVRWIVSRFSFGKSKLDPKKIRFDLCWHTELSRLDRFQEGIFSLNKVFKKIFHKWIKLYLVTLRGHIGAARLSGAKISGHESLFNWYVSQNLFTQFSSLVSELLSLVLSKDYGLSFPLRFFCSLNRIQVLIWEK